MTNSPEHPPANPPAQPTFDIGQWTAAEIILFGRVSHLKSKWATGIWFPNFTSAFESFEQQMETLGKRNVELLAEVCIQWAVHPNRQARTDAPFYLEQLTRSDSHHDIGIKLWDQLLRDEDKYVRGHACGMLIGRDEETSEEKLLAVANDQLTDSERKQLADDNMTREELRRLVEAYHRAEQGENLHHVGETALSTVLDEVSKNIVFDIRDRYED